MVSPIARVHCNCKAQCMGATFHTVCLCPVLKPGGCSMHLVVAVILLSTLLLAPAYPLGLTQSISMQLFYCSFLGC